MNSVWPPRFVFNKQTKEEVVNSVWLSLWVGFSMDWWAGVLRTVYGKGLCGVLRTVWGAAVWGAADCGVLRLLKIEDGRNGD